VSFTGFPEEAFEFFAAVAADTSWETVRARSGLHERAVRAPMEALAAELGAEFGPAKVYNLHRSPDLWTTQYAYVSPVDTIALGVSLSLDGLAVEGGWLRSSPDQVERYRTAVAGPAGSRLAETVADLERSGYELLGVTLRGVPRGYPAEHPRADLLRRRSLVAARSLERDPWLHGPQATERVHAEWLRLRPLTDWLAKHVGPRDVRSL
jgi:uncharacterized protein (DUF2461 family)